MVWFGVLVFLCQNGFMMVNGDADAQVLITNRGEPAPFPHFPTVVGPAPAAPIAAPIFEFAPTPNGKPIHAAVTTPVPPTLLATPAFPEIPQALGKIMEYWLKNGFSVSK